jgi:hypothetical protein
VYHDLVLTTFHAPAALVGEDLLLAAGLIAGLASAIGLMIRYCSEISWSALGSLTLLLLASILCGWQLPWL